MLHSPLSKLFPTTLISLSVFYCVPSVISSFSFRFKFSAVTFLICDKKQFLILPPSFRYILSLVQKFVKQSKQFGKIDYRNRVFFIEGNLEPEEKLNLQFFPQSFKTKNFSKVLKVFLFLNTRNVATDCGKKK